MKKPESICVFGDSTGWGAWDMEKAGWVNRLWVYVAHRERDEDYVELYNQCIPGGTSEKILARFEAEAHSRKAEALIFQTGANDASFWGSTHKPLVSLEKFKENLQEIFDRAKKITPNIVFIGLKNCIESKTTPVSWIDLHFVNKDIQLYATVAKEVCDNKGIKYIDIKPLDDSDFDEDGLHPNASGHEKIYTQVRDALVEIGWV